MILVRWRDGKKFRRGKKDKKCYPGNGPEGYSVNKSSKVCACKEAGLRWFLSAISRGGSCDANRGWSIESIQGPGRGRLRQDQLSEVFRESLGVRLGPRKVRDIDQISIFGPYNVEITIVSD